MPPLSSPVSLNDNPLQNLNQDTDYLKVSESEDEEPFIRRFRRAESFTSDTEGHGNQHVTFTDESAEESWDDEPFDEMAGLKARLQDRKRLDSIRTAEFVYPPSHYEGYVPPMVPSKERDVIKDFMKVLEHMKLQEHGVAAERDFDEFDLNDFTIYLPDSVAHYPGTMTGLQNLATKSANSWYCFDGILSLGKDRKYVQGVPFKLCSIGNYGCEIDSVGDEMWIQSDFNSSSKIYYRLKSPSSEYERYHEDFVWLANLAKHFFDFLESRSERRMEVSIHNFKANFVTWLEKIRGKSPAYQSWYSQYNRRDFRGHVSANIDFLWKETHGISEELLKHPIWKEVKSVDFIPMQKLRAKGTVVTPYVYECFRHLRFGDQLSKVVMSSNVQHRRKSLGRILQLTTEVPVMTCPLKGELEKPLDVKSIAVGDVIAVPMDDKHTSLWKDEASKWKAADDCWYVLVQEIHINKHGQRSFDTIWLYKPSDTTCAKMKYPHSNELFLSDNCSCDTHRIKEEEVLFKVLIDWNGLPGDTTSDFFIRQTYLRNNAFVTMKECHKRCIHLRDEVKTPLQEVVDNFKVGDTVLYVPPSHLKPKYGLEPGEIIEFLQQGANGFVKIRRLLRRRDLDSMVAARPNELVYSDELCSVPASRVTRKCFVRFFSQTELEQRTIPAPYDRDGTGDIFYIITRLVGEGLEPIPSVSPPSLIEGPDFRSTLPQHRLRGLDLYCGGGNFGRGLEEGGYILNTHAVDLDRNAIHTYWANLESRKTTKLFYGSVNDMLTVALEGNPSKSSLVPLPGDIDFISAGSPCPGFSVLNSRRDNAQGLQNQSLVASVAAYIDVFRPKYALLENVITMAQKGKGRDEDVLSQLICCIVGMGYQVQVFNLDSWSFGSPQSRSRLFVSIAAPGLEPPPHPSLSHSHPDGTRERGLGLMASGHPFGERLFKRTPFDYVTAQGGTEDLPDIGDGRTYHCTSHPDHRMARGITQKLKAQIEIIPLSPRGMNFARTLKLGLMTKAERSLFPILTRGGRPCHNVAAGSKAWERVHPQKLFPTIATSASPGCARTGRCLHWDQQRLITVLEARRAQSFPDDEVITGLQPKQWRIIGNSVARTVSLALGLSIGEACRTNLLAAQNLTLAEPAMNGAFISDVDSTINSFASAQEEINQSSSADSGAQSEKKYTHALDTSGLKSSASGDDTSETSDSPQSSDEPVRQAKRRRHSVFATLANSRKEKKNGLSAQLSKRDPMLWGHIRSTVFGDDNTSSDSMIGSQRSQSGSSVIKAKRPTFQQRQPKPDRSPGEVKTDFLKRKRVGGNINKTASSESDTRRLNRIGSRDLAGLQSRHPVSQIQKTEGTVPVSTKSSQIHKHQNKRQTSLADSVSTGLSNNQTTLRSQIKPSQYKSREVINLVSDEDEAEDETNTDDSGDNPLFVSASKRKQVQAYVPVDNSIFVAYARTHGTMRPGSKQR